MRPGKDFAIKDHLVGPYFDTSSIIFSSSYKKEKQNDKFSLYMQEQKASKEKTPSKNLLGPWSFNEIRIENLLPSMQALNFWSIMEVLSCMQIFIWWASCI